MRTINTVRSLVMLLGAVALSACEKNAVQDITGTRASSQIRFFNFGVNAPGVNYYANDAKVTAVLSSTGAELTTGVAYGAVGNSGYYSAIEPGSYTFTGRIAAATDKDLSVSRLTATIADGKSYSLYTSGIYDATAKNVESFIVEDNYPAEYDFSQTYVRFVNAISNSQPLQLYAKNTTTGVETPVGGAVAYKAGSTFTQLPGAVYDLRARATGATTDAVVRTAVSFVNGRVYTISARGDITVVSTTATNRPFLDNTANR